MFIRLSALLVFVLFINISFSQAQAQDTIFLMNGHVIAKKVFDTTFSTVTILHPRNPNKKIHYETDQLYMVKFASGYKRYYYIQDPEIYNVFTRDEMWLFMKGEQDARKGFKARGSLITSIVLGFGLGLTGSFLGPIVPYGFMALTGLPKVRIRHNTVSNPQYLESDAYILGYERVARQKRKSRAIIGGTIGLVLGYGCYAAFHNVYLPNNKL
jgi:hypothetical protein